TMRLTISVVLPAPAPASTSKFVSRSVRMRSREDWSGSAVTLSTSRPNGSSTVCACAGASANSRIWSGPGVALRLDIALPQLLQCDHRVDAHAIALEPQGGTVDDSVAVELDAARGLI